MTPDIMKTAILGLGHIGRIHVQALQETPGYQLVAACDHQADTASLLPDSTAFYASHHVMLRTGGFDTVVVATPNSTHYPFALDALKAGYHVIIEKPAARNLKELEELVYMGNQASRHIYFAFHAACAREVVWLQEHLQRHGEEYGSLTGFFCRFFDPYIDAEGHLRPQAKGLDDCWSDSGVNALSVLDGVLPVEHLTLSSQRQSGRLSIPPGICSLSAGFTFPVKQRDCSGLGIIETAWDQGINHKSTELCYGCTGFKLIVNHSQQSVTSVSPEGLKNTLAAFPGERLVNHYRNVFQDYRYRWKTGVMNGERALSIHRRLFEIGLS